MSRGCIVTAYLGDDFAQLAALTLPRMEAFAARHGYELIVHKPDGSGFTDSWMKVPAIISALQSGFDFVLWLDIDVLILRTDRDILEDAQPGADLLVAWHGPDTMRLDGAPFPPHYNAGVYLIRRSEWSLEFFTRLLAMHGEVNHPWQEQAALLMLLGYNESLGSGPNVANEQDRSHIGHLDPIWNSIPGIAMATDPIVHHFAGLKGTTRLDLVKANAEILPVYGTASPAIRSALSHQISRWAAAEHLAQSLRYTLVAQSIENHEGQTAEIERLKHDVARLRAPRQMLRALPGAVTKRLRDKIDDVSGISSSSPGFKFEVELDSVQNLRPEGKLERFEGLAFSTSGDTLGVATADSNAVLLYRRTENGIFEDKPYFRLGGLDYPHDLSFSTCGSTELLAVAQRTGALALFRENGNGYDSDPVFEISGAETKLTHSDGVSFVPPFNDYLAACNLGTSSISFYPRLSLSPLRFALKPDFELTHSSVIHPDGLAFSECGRWLAIANHGNGSVSIFQRRNKLFAAGKLKYGPEPVTIIEDKSLRYPHSVAFTPRTSHLVVTNAGGNFFSVYEPRRSHFGLNWSQVSSAQTIVGDDQTFRAVNAHNKMEGGPKGLAVHGNTIAVCSPEIGIKLYSFQEA